jgi:glyoxylase-like metal-dependent hydrolase (beta-lactamase superfamily II)
VYLMGDVLVDAATRHARRRILRQLAGRPVSAHALTHAHPDHQGASKAVCDELEIPLWCGEGDVEAMQTAGAIRASQPASPLNRLVDSVWTGPPHPVARVLREGDEVAGFSVLEVPGHSAGHLAYYRETDGALVLGDVLNNMNLLTGIPGLREPPTVFTPDPARNRESARKLAALEPRLVCFGHGPPLRDPQRLRAFVDGLARD